MCMILARPLYSEWAGSSGGERMMSKAGEILIRHGSSVSRPHFFPLGIFVFLVLLTVHLASHCRCLLVVAAVVEGVAAEITAMI